MRLAQELVAKVKLVEQTLVSLIDSVAAVTPVTCFDLYSPIGICSTKATPVPGNLHILAHFFDEKIWSDLRKAMALPLTVPNIGGFATSSPKHVSVSGLCAVTGVAYQASWAAHMCSGMCLQNLCT